MIAGCLNQSRRIFQLFEEVLQGETPEALVVETHNSIRSLLKSDEAQGVINSMENNDVGSVAARDTFIKKIVGAVHPIIPVALRNKSLDGGYFRTALKLLGATEMLFTRYVPDVRVLANPAGVVGMCTAMHAELERAAFLGEDLRPLKESMKDMKSQYQTSLGLGTPFLKDSRKKQAKKTRKRPAFRRRLGRPGFGQYGVDGVAQNNMTDQGFGSQGRHNRQNQRWSATGNGARAPCYDYQAGECRRGNACRFSHANN